MRGGWGVEEVDVTMQPLKGEAMPLQQSPCDDFTSTVTPLDTDTPSLPNQNLKPLSLQLLVPIGLLMATVAKVRKEWTERTRANRGEGWVGSGGVVARRGPYKRSTVGHRFLLGVQEGGGRSGSMR